MLAHISRCFCPEENQSFENIENSLFQLLIDFVPPCINRGLELLKQLTSSLEGVWHLFCVDIYILCQFSRYKFVTAHYWGRLTTRAKCSKPQSTDNVTVFGRIQDIKKLEAIFSTSNVEDTSGIKLEGHLEPASWSLILRSSTSFSGEPNSSILVYAAGSIIFLHSSNAFSHCSRNFKSLQEYQQISSPAFVIHIRVESRTPWSKLAIKSVFT